MALPSENLFCLLLLLFPFSSSLSTVSISHNSNQTIVCALIAPSATSQGSTTVLNCTSFPSGIRVPLSSPNISFSGIAGGDGFLAALMTSSSSSTSTVLRWRFSSNQATSVPYKRIYRGRVLNNLVAGNSSLCGSKEETGSLQCWQWPRFDANPVQNFSSVAVGDDFLCGLTSIAAEIRCLGEDSGIVGSEPSGTNYSLIAAGSQHACALSSNGTLRCWGRTLAGKTPQGQFTSLALGGNRSCTLRPNGTVECWDDGNFNLPARLQETSFASIQGKGSTFCGVLLTNFSLTCWGNDLFELIDSSTIFNNVMPGPCSSSCPVCGPLPGSGRLCPSGLTICAPCVRRENPSFPSSPPSLPPSSGGGLNRKLVAFLIVGCIGSLSVVAISGLAIFWYCKEGVCRIHDSGPMGEPRTAAEDQAVVPPFLEKRLSHLYSTKNGGSLEEFPLSVLLEATNNFSNEHRIGTGSFGSVYQAILADGRQVAIKRAETLVPYYRQQEEEDNKDVAFVNELEFLSRLNHKNLVCLIGFCEDSNERALVYEYMANGTLHEHLHRQHNDDHSQRTASLQLMSWTARIRVALEAARGIEYLHEYAVPSIIHRDIKTANILLDSTWSAKISDFGLSLPGPDPNGEASHLSMHAAGTMGYIDPEYYRLQQLTKKSDVYSFGVVLLELLCGQKAIHRDEHGLPHNVIDLVVPYIAQDDIHKILDPRVPPPTPSEIEAVVFVGYLAADCVTLAGRDRPSMTDVVSGLEKALSACLNFPPSLSSTSTGSFPR